MVLVEKLIQTDSIRDLVTTRLYGALHEDKLPVTAAVWMGSRRDDLSRNIGERNDF